MNARGIAAKTFRGGEGLDRIDVWVERTDRNEVLMRCEDSDGDQTDVYLTIDQCEELEGLLELAHREPWRRS